MFRQMFKAMISETYNKLSAMNGLCLKICGITFNKGYKMNLLSKTKVKLKRAGCLRFVSYDNYRLT